MHGKLAEVFKKLALVRAEVMYKFNHNRQYTLDDFDQPMGLPGYTMELSFVPSLMVESRKRLDDDILMEISIT